MVLKEQKEQKLKNLKSAKKILQARIAQGMDAYYNPSGLLADLDEKIKLLEQELGHKNPEDNDQDQEEDRTK